MDEPAVPRVLVVANKTAATPALLEAVRARAAQGAVTFHLLVPNPDIGGWRPSDVRHPDVSEGEQVLALALPLLEQAAGAPVTGAVSIRHDPMDAVEETLQGGRFDEVIVSTLPHHVSMWLHVDLPRRVAHLGLPVTTVLAQHPVASG
jgi:hypothetical protein